MADDCNEDIILCKEVSALFTKMYLDASAIVGGDYNVYNPEARFRVSDDARQLAIAALLFVLLPRAS